MVINITCNAQIIDTSPDGWDDDCIRAAGVVALDEANPNLRVHPGGLGNLVTGLGSAKVGFLAYPMQNFIRNTIGTSVLMNGGLQGSKPAI